ncbi:MAG: glycerate kinase, partial [Rhodobacteraceae bacterium]|nr:glycerate kinase [Paracoccaceae bacterium]
MRILAAPDSFKGSLTAPEAAAHMAAGIRRAAPGAEVICFPVADGGEGTASALLAATGGRWVAAEVMDPLYRPL